MVRDSDLEIMQILSDNSRTSFVKIGKKIGVSETAIRKRVKKLEDLGAIRKYTVDINPKKIGFEIDALIGIDTKPEKYMKVIDKIKIIDSVVSLYSSSGDHMIMIECWLKDSEKLSEFMKMLEGMDGVTKICPAIILEKVK